MKDNTQVQKGTTPSWLRPVKVEIKLETSTVNLFDILVGARMVQSKAEAKRIVEQGIIWKDKDWSPSLIGTCIWDRIFKIPKDINFKEFPAQIGDLLCIGRVIDEAICHRIEFI